MPEYSNLPDVSVDWHLSNVRRNSRPVEGQNDLDTPDNRGGFMIATADRCPVRLCWYSTVFPVTMSLELASEEQQTGSVEAGWHV